MTEIIPGTSKKRSIDDWTVHDMQLSYTFDVLEGLRWSLGVDNALDSGNPMPHAAEAVDTHQLGHHYRAGGADPTQVVAYEIDDHRSQLVGIRHRQGQRLRTALHPGDMVVQAEDSRLAVAPAIGLEAFEAGAGVVKDVCCRMDRQWPRGHDLVFGPDVVAKTRDGHELRESGTKRGRIRSV